MPRRLELAGLMTLLGLACGGGSAQGEHTVRLEAASAAELSALSAAFSEAVASGAERIEVRLAPGTYADTSLVLRDTARPPTVQLDLRSDGPGPAILTNTRLSLQARALHVEGVVVQDWAQAESPVVLAVGESLTLTAATFRRLTPQQPGVAPVHIKGIKKAGPKTLRLDRVWVTDSRAERLILVDTSAADPATEMTVARSGFVDNEADTLIFGYALKHLAVDGSVAVGAKTDSLLWCGWSESEASLSDSLLSLSGAQPWLRRDTNPPDPGATFAEPTVTGATIKAGVMVPRPLPDHPDQLRAQL